MLKITVLKKATKNPTWGLLQITMHNKMFDSFYAMLCQNDKNVFSDITPASITSDEGKKGSSTSIPTKVKVKRN
jgi:hypothetical protein